MQPSGARPPDATARMRAIALVILAGLAVGYTIAIGRPFLMPIAFAWLARLLLAPVVRWLGRLHLRPPVGAAIVLVCLAAAAGAAAYSVSGPANEWTKRLPDTIAAIQSKVRRGFQDSPLENVNKATKAVADLADGRPEQEKPIEVAVVDREPATAVLYWLQAFGANVLIMMVLLYLLLATEDAFTIKVLASLPGAGERQSTRQLVLAIEAHVARYLATITVTNIALGTAVGFIVWAFGMPNPPLWGVMAALANFVPYLGGLVGVAVVATVGIASFDTLEAGLAPALAYAAVNCLEGLVITPLVLGHRLLLSPVVLFLWLFLLGLLWGIPGALVAVPLLATIKIAADHIPRMAPLARFLGR